MRRLTFADRHQRSQFDSRSEPDDCGPYTLNLWRDPRDGKVRFTYSWPDSPPDEDPTTWTPLTLTAIRQGDRLEDDAVIILQWLLALGVL